ncbi:SH3 domain-containing protein [Chitinophaga sp. Cy-1792]|uniref:SH3 domain-containing protein n=1 Tax=Chitinophaga sp. Cy-1792 TaxID=2608339 RepID=UPI00141DEBC9|nr:SH3 domain-containing protein [Chitinophaga sp. Cy-1792]NIG54800.1 SH3 domain-containing protein [Chitinophaga sp. Cy-1792]
MKKLFIFLLLFTAENLYAQEAATPDDLRSLGISVDTIGRYIFADTAFIRSSPDTRKTATDTLYAGDNIQVIAITDNMLTIRGLKGPWLKINYIRDSIAHIGYIWAGMVSCQPLRRGDTKFVYGIERKKDSTWYNDFKQKVTQSRFVVKLKTVKQRQIISQASFSVFNDESANFSYGKVMSGMGLTGVQHVIALNFTGDACSIPSNYYYFAFTADSMLVKFPERTELSEAGISYHNENFIFPNEKNGKPDMILWVMTNEDFTDKKDKNGKYIHIITEKQEKQYSWNYENKQVSVK